MSDQQQAEADGHRRIVRQYAMQVILTDLLVSLYRAAPDPAQDAADHRARLRLELSTKGREPALSPADREAYEEIADAVDEILEAAGRRASGIAELLGGT